MDIAEALPKIFYIIPHTFLFKSGITEEVRDLIKNVKHAENIDEWTKGYGIGEPKEVKTWRPNWDKDIDDDQHFDMKYYPHKGKLICIFILKAILNPNN